MEWSVCNEMFGRRADGRVVKNIDPIIGLTPYLMPMRCDAQVMLSYKLDYERLARYIVRKSGEGYKITFMDLVIAAYVRTISQLPELNRFIANKRIYARTELTTSFAVLKNTRDGSAAENTAKCKFDPHDTIFDVSARIAKAIDISRREDADNNTMKVAQLLNNPLVANIVVLIARVLDRYGLLPRIIVDASPFHTSMFIANMASIGMPAVNHHIYNFGTTSLFLGLGAIQREVELDGKGNPVRKRWLPIGVVADERVCEGVNYGKMITSITNYLNNPELLEKPPEQVFFDEGNVYSEPKVPHKRRGRYKKLRFRRNRKNRMGIAG